MERVMDMETKTDQHVAHVVKDRSTLLDGKECADPTFAFFMPHVKRLNLGGKQLGIDTSRTSDAMIPADARDDKIKQRAILIEEIEALLVQHFPASTGNDRKRKIELLKSHLRTGSWKAVESMPLFDLRAGYESLHQELEGKPSLGVGPITQKVELVAHPLDIPESLRRTLPDLPQRTEDNWVNEFVGLGE